MPNASRTRAARLCGFGMFEGALRHISQWQITTSHHNKYHQISNLEWSVVTCNNLRYASKGLVAQGLWFDWKKQEHEPQPSSSITLCLMHGILRRWAKYHEKSFWKHGATLITFYGRCFKEQAARDMDPKLCPARTTDVLVISPSRRRGSLHACKGMMPCKDYCLMPRSSDHFPSVRFLDLLFILCFVFLVIFVIASSRDSRMTLTLFIHVHHSKLWQCGPKSCSSIINKGRAKDHRGITMCGLLGLSLGQ